MTELVCDEASAPAAIMDGSTARVIRMAAMRSRLSEAAQSSSAVPQETMEALRRADVVDQDVDPAVGERGGAGRRGPRRGEVDRDSLDRPDPTSASSGRAGAGPGDGVAASWVSARVTAIRCPCWRR